MKQFLIYVFILLSLSACKKNLSVFWEDDDAENLAVFSNTGNNIMSCYTNGMPFSTVPRMMRTSFPGSLYSFELDVSRHLKDSLKITWYGNKINEFGTSEESISVVFYVNKNFTLGEFNSLTGQRLRLDGKNGYFLMKSRGNEKGIGNIYFHKAESNIVNGDAEGEISGLFDAQFSDMKITKGRFDHYLVSKLLWL